VTPAQIDEHLETERRFLRFVTCGSVDDGKSTLIGRLLYEGNLVFEDQLEALRRDSARFGTQNGELDFALLMDGLMAEREQGITIDTAYRFFATPRRKFIVADAPGHVQYTRNMVTGASTADASVIVVDAQKGVVTQTRRHTHLLSLLGIRRAALAVNKMDLVRWDERRFRSIENEYRSFARQTGLTDVVGIPVCALHGDNIVAPSENMPWYDGTTLLAHLEAVPLDEERNQQHPFRMPVQWVNRPDSTFRGFSGTIASGVINSGDGVVVQPSGAQTKVDRIVTYDGDLDRAVAGQAVTLTLATEIDISRGDVLAKVDEPAEVADQFAATIVWMSRQPLLAGRPCLIKIGTRTVPATVTRIKYRINVDTMEHVAATTLELNEIGVCNVSLEAAIPFDVYRENGTTGGFILIDRITNETSGVGMIDFALRRAHNLQLQPLTVDKYARAALMGQRPFVVWFTGLSGAGKSTIANLVEVKLRQFGRRTYLLDGDNVRHGLNRDLGFTDADRVENIRRVGEVAKLMVDAGLIVLVAFISPFRSERRMARGLVGEEEFVEVFVNAPLAVAEGRDPKGLYRKARRGELKNFTGIDSPYEEPEGPELEVRTADCLPEAAAEQVISRLRGLGLLD
jgi:bifunctional enzyme CysN/CysC